MNVKQGQNRVLFPKTVNLVMCLFFVSMLAGCLENYGRLKRDRQIQRTFETYQVPTDLNYYFHGVSSYPDAIMGLDPDYKLRSRIWRTVDPNTERFRRMVYWVWTDYWFRPYGAHILDPDGRHIGIFYTSVSFAAVKVDRESKTVEVMPHIFHGGPLR